MKRSGRTMRVRKRRFGEEDEGDESKSRVRKRRIGRM